MNNEELKRKQSAKRKKILLIAVLVIIGLLLLLFIAAMVLNSINEFLKEKNKEKLEQEIKTPNYVFENIKPNENIFEDEAYMDKDRSIRFKDAEITIAITEENYSEQPDEIKYMYDIINFIINGDYESYNACFIDSYFKTAGDDVRETFTMQKLYNIELELLYTEESETNEIKLSKYDFKLSYMIKNNNGTFRNDLDKESYRPVVYRVMKTVNKMTNAVELSIYSLLLNSKYESGLYE